MPPAWDRQEGPITAEERSQLRTVPIGQALRAYLVARGLVGQPAERRADLRPFDATACLGVTYGVRAEWTERLSAAYTSAGIPTLAS